MLNTKIVTKELKEFKDVKNLLETVFPKNEQFPMKFLISKSKKDGIDFLAFYDEEKFIGFAYLVTNNTLTSIMYLAVDPTIHSKGYGSKILEWIKKEYFDNRIVLNIEIVDDKASNNKQRIKRKKFYLKNGYLSTNIRVEEYHVLYETLVLGDKINVEEYISLYKKFMGTSFYHILNPKIYYID